MADAILNGDFDEVTGEWLGEGQGFPRTLTKRALKTDKPLEQFSTNSQKAFGCGHLESETTFNSLAKKSGEPTQKGYFG